MTEVRTTLRSAYLAGPMRGHEEFNFPAFKSAAAALRERGWKIWSPAENDEKVDGFNAKTDDAKDFDYYMARDLEAVCSQDALVLLPGWEASQGARLEALVAVEVGHPVFEIERLGKVTWGELSSVDPEYVLKVFGGAKYGFPEPEFEIVDQGEPSLEDYPGPRERYGLCCGDCERCGPTNVENMMDPTPFMPGMKDTNPKDAIGSGKIPLHLWPTTATVYGALGLLDGMLKYGRGNWRVAGVRASIYYDALSRHMAAWFEGEDLDPDSGLPHLAHALACIAIVIDAGEAGMLTDDRQYPGGYRSAVEALTPQVDAAKARHAERSPRHYTRDDA